jgi:hypothetical protein
MIPSEFAIKAFGGVISVQDSPLPSKVGDKLPCLRMLAEEAAQGGLHFAEE